MYQHTVYYLNSHDYQDRKAPKGFYSLRDCLTQLEAWEGKGYVSLADDRFSPYAEVLGCGGSYYLRIGEDYGAGQVDIDNLIDFLTENFPSEVETALQRTKTDEHIKES